MDYQARLLEIQKQVAWYGSYKRSGEEPEGRVLSPEEAAKAVTALFLESVGENKPTAIHPNPEFFRGQNYARDEIRSKWQTNQEGGE